MFLHLITGKWIFTAYYFLNCKCRTATDNWAGHESFPENLHSARSGNASFRQCGERNLLHYWISQMHSVNEFCKSAIENCMCFLEQQFDNNFRSTVRSNRERTGNNWVVVDLVHHIRMESQFFGTDLIQVTLAIFGHSLIKHIQKLARTENAWHRATHARNERSSDQNDSQEPRLLVIVCDFSLTHTVAVHFALWKRDHVKHRLLPEQHEHQLITHSIKVSVSTLIHFFFSRVPITTKNKRDACNDTDRANTSEKEVDERKYFE